MQKHATALITVTLVLMSTGQGLASSEARSLVREAFNDNTAALQKLTAAAQAGTPADETWLGVFYTVRQNYAEADDWLRKAAAQGDAHAEFELGQSYHYGYGVPKNYTEANVWYQKAAGQGFVHAKYKRLCAMSG